eukprot:TRINITY_DN9211_c0_g1_i1.p1 TRINITY_DN9211_c0_g1~~TRINITY_DN9211_c0_g1_i1.p1  ORF type:complete len:327 (+),score=69.56 TRINITY_DN9211_c0_g1_i1:52-1032(+)
MSGSGGLGGKWRQIKDEILLEKDKLSRDNLFIKYKQLSLTIAGAGSGAVTKTSIAPLERIKILIQIEGMQVQPNPAIRSGLISAFNWVMKNEGFLSLYRGNGANVIRVIPNYALKFSFNDKFRDIVKREGQTVSDLNFFQMFAAGASAGMFQIIMTYPLEVVRTRLALGDAFGMGVKYKGITDCFLNIATSERLIGLYKGLTPTLIAGIPYVGFQMTFYELIKRVLIDEDSNYITARKLACGALAGLFAQTLVFPGDTVRRRMQTNGIGGKPLVYTGTLNCFKTILKKEGVRGLFRGMSANVVRCIPGAAIQFASYDFIKKQMGID